MIFFFLLRPDMFGFKSFTKSIGDLFQLHHPVSQPESISKGSRVSKAGMGLSRMSSTKVSSLWMCLSRVGSSCMSLARIGRTGEGQFSLSFLPSTSRHLVLSLAGRFTGGTREGSTELETGRVERSVSWVRVGRDLGAT